MYCQCCWLYVSRIRMLNFENLAAIRLDGNCSAQALALLAFCWLAIDSAERQMDKKAALICWYLGMLNVQCWYNVMTKYNRVHCVTSTRADWAVYCQITACLQVLHSVLLFSCRFAPHAHVERCISSDWFRTFEWLWQCMRITCHVPSNASSQSTAEHCAVWRFHACSSASFTFCV